MATITSKQAARIAAGKASPGDFAKVRVCVITTPDTVAWADGDIVPSGQRLPTGTRILATSYASHEALGASVVLDLGLRKWDDKTAIDADGIAAGADISAAGRTILNNGDLMKGGVEYVTTEPSELYFTVRGAAGTANRQIRVEVPCLIPG